MNERYMNEALKEAKKAYAKGEVPIGAVIVENDVIIARAHNTKDLVNCATRHAEINAIEIASKLKDNWRLNDCELYVTLLPCPMCASAINQARMNKVIYGTGRNNIDIELIKTILVDNTYGNSVDIIGNIMEDECSKLLKDFFVEKR